MIFFQGDLGPSGADIDVVKRKLVFDISHNIEENLPSHLTVESGKKSFDCR